MKKKNLIAVLASVTLLASCSSSIEAQPGYVSDPLVNVVGSDSSTETIYQNEFTDLYDALVNAGTSNSTIVDKLLLKMAQKEIGVSESDPDIDALKALGYQTLNEVGFVPNAEGVDAQEKYEQLIDDYMVDRVMDGAYSEDYLFQEVRFAREQRQSLYIIKDKDGSTTGDNFNEDIALVPGITYDEIFSSREAYQDYRTRVVSPIIYRRLLTAKYLYNNKYKSLGRAGARNVRLVKIDNSSTEDKGSAIRTLNNYVGGFLYAQTSNQTDAENYFPGEKVGDNYVFSVDDIASIWKGVWDEGDNADENAHSAKLESFVNGSNLGSESLYTRYTTIEEELDRIATYDEASDHYTLREGLDYENSNITDLLSRYTGGYSYSLDWGVTLARRELMIDDIVEDDFYIERTGLTDLPSDIRGRLFSMTVSNNVTTVGDTTFLLPAKKANTTGGESSEDSHGNLVCTSMSSCVQEAANLIHYDSESSTYYVVLVDQYDYSTSDLDGGESTAETIDQERRAKAINIAVLLGENSTHQRDSLIHYFTEYKLTYHDQDFYDYLESTYPDIFDED